MKQNFYISEAIWEYFKEIRKHFSTGTQAIDALYHIPMRYNQEPPVGDYSWRCFSLSKKMKYEITWLAEHLDKSPSEIFTMLVFNYYLHAYIILQKIEELKKSINL